MFAPPASAAPSFAARSVSSASARSFLRACTLLAACLVAGCGTTDPDPGDDAGPPSSCEPDRACPESAPVWGGPCDGTLECSFVSACGPGSDDVYECVAGQWSLTMPAPCAGGSPPLVETCRTPFTGSLSGARVWLSEDRAGAPELGEGDTIEVAFGSQGLAMVPFRVHVDGVDPASAPGCVRVATSLTLDGAPVPPTPSVQAVRLRCGASLRIQEILPDLPCESRDYAIGVDVTVEGVGTVRVDLTAAGGGCPLGPTG